MSFTEFGLSPDVLRAIEDAGFTQPTPIQQQAIPYALMGRDVLGCAQTGTGKTACYGIPILETLSSGRARARMPRSLILTPTRELATQVAEHFELLGKYRKLSVALLIGGVSADDQIRVLDRGADVLIATPGRLLDHFGNGRILLSDIKVLVIDEADRMLDMGFIPDVEKIIGLLPRIRQTLLFSATLLPEIRRLADKFLINPKEVTVAPPARTADTVDQSLYVIAAEDKREALRRLIESEDVKNALVFCNRKKDVDILFKSLKKHGFDAAAIHGDLSQSVRTETLQAFRDDKIRLLVASDVAARGLDITDLSHVFNFDVPTHAEEYVHRIGRTGRAGRAGRALMLATPDDAPLVDAITKLIGKDIPRRRIEGLDNLELGDPAPRRRRGRRGGDRRDRRHGAEAEAARRPTAAPQGRRHAEEPVRMSPSEPPRRPQSEPPRPVHRPEPRREHRERGAEPVLAFGDHTPAFLLRVPRRPAPLDNEE
jgi:superfamily II DNA/RNA helicase